MHPFSVSLYQPIFTKAIYIKGTRMLNLEIVYMYMVKKQGYVYDVEACLHPSAPG